MSQVDVVIVNYNSAAHTAACVEAVHRVARADGMQVKVVVVNNRDNAQELEASVHERGPAICVHNDTNVGFGAACNQGAALGDAPLILFLNPDALLHPGYFKHVVAFMAEPANADIGILGPAIEGNDGRIAETCAPLPTRINLATRTLGLTRGFLPADDHARSGSVGQVMGAVLMIRRAVFSELGGFDARFFLYYEDVDLCARAAARGYATYYLTSARATHIGRVSSSQDTGMSLALFLRSRFTYARLHFGILSEAMLVLLSFVGELPLRLLATWVGGKSITGIAVLRAYGLLLKSLVTGVNPVRIAPARQG